MTHPYKVAGIALGIPAFLFGGFMLVGLLLPAEWTARSSVEISATAEEVFPFLDQASAWDEWTPSPESGTEHFGPAEGPGSGRRWNDPAYGEGQFVIVTSEPPRRLTYRVEVEGGAILIQGEMRLDPNSEGVRLSWHEEGNFGWNPLLGYVAGRMTELQSAQLEGSLNTLKELAEGRIRSRPD